MAEEDEGGGAPAPAGGSVLKKYGPLAAIVLLAQVVLAWVVIKITSPASTADQDTHDPLIPQAQEQVMDEEEDSGGLPFVYMDPLLDRITFNPAETNAERYAVVSIRLGLMGTNDDGEVLKPAEIGADAASLEMITANIGLIKSTCVGVLRGKTVDDFESGNIDEVWKDLKTALNETVFSKIRWAGDDAESKKKINVRDIIAVEVVIT